MKILEEGKDLENQKVNAWDGVKMRCGKCGCVFELESSDKPHAVQERRMGGNTTLTIDCPQCGEKCSKIVKSVTSFVEQN